MGEVQRSNYADHKVMALRNADWLTMVIDGMDQVKTNIARFSKEDKHTTRLPKIITHITGVMVYTGKGIREFAFVDMGQFPHDSNLWFLISTQLVTPMKTDQLFSSINSYLRTRDTCTVDGELRDSKLSGFKEFLRDKQRMHKDSLPMLLSRDAFTISRSPMNMKNSVYQMMISWRWKVELAYTQL
ncbi:unnamed protein product [Darwinula stevensoni]|uniref:Uncharacterized protein n=1 Tax=Darwinula stevensoni TaxID=69355 RepID=A0A7R9AD07_9CRUS|nr:unnamed protein product [Darwinula stevensoni]CAG0900826.1 unnamed protein product [Darwinula stevensoni]